MNWDHRRSGCGLMALAVACLVPVSCGDSTGPEHGRLHDGYVLERVGVETLPAQLKDWGNGFGLFMVGGGVRCPDPKGGSPDQESYEFLANDPWYSWEVTVRLEVVCEEDPPNRLRFTYPATGETIVGTVWEGAGEETGYFFQTKRIPSRETFTATIAGMEGLPIYWDVLLLDNPAPEATFRRSR